MNYEQLISSKLDNPHGQIIVFFGLPGSGKSIAAKNLFPDIDFLLNDASVQLFLGSKLELDDSDVTDNSKNNDLIIVDEAHALSDNSLIQLLSLVRNRKKLLLIVQSLDGLINFGQKLHYPNHLIDAFSPHAEEALYIEFLGPFNIASPKIFTLAELKSRKHL
jgi:hypothetical protein